jgi:hypothetical protein
MLKHKKAKNVKFGGLLHPIEREFRDSHTEAILLPEQEKKTPEKPFTTEHQTITSRTTGLPHEISFGMLDNGNVPRNPFVSQNQQRFLYSHPEKIGKKALAEWSSKTDFKSLPKKVKKK